MAIDILKGSSSTPLLFLMVQSSDHITALTGASPTVKIGKNGATGAAPSGAITEVDATNLPGLYKVAGNATDTNTAGPLWLHATATSGDPTDLMVANIIDPTVAVYGANTVNVGGTAQTGRDLGASVLLSSGTGTGQISLSSGAVLLQATQTGVTIPTVTTVTNQLTAAQVATGIWQDSTAGDFTVSSSIGKSLYTSGNAPGAASGIALVGSNVGAASSVTGAVGSVTGSVGSVVGLTASNLDTTVSSRMATYTQPTGFLAATFPSGTLANQTNITAGTIATVSGNVNGTVGTAAALTANLDKTGYALTSSYDFAKGTVAMTESYAALNATLTPAQALYGLTQQLGEQGISGTTMTVKKRDQSTTAKTYTLNDATNPSAITEAS